MKNQKRTTALALATALFVMVGISPALAIDEVAADNVMAGDIAIEDENLLACINSELGQPADSVISPTQAANLGELTCEKAGVTNLQGLQPFTSLNYLDLTGNQVSSLTPLRGLSALRTLSLENNFVTDLGPLRNLVNLNYLTVGSNQIADIQVLSQMSGLWLLGLENNQIGDLTPLSRLVNLQELAASGNKISDLNPLKRLVNLRYLNLDHNQVIEIGALSALTKLRLLSLQDNSVSDLRPLRSMSQLGGLFLQANQLTDLVGIEELRSLQVLSVGEDASYESGAVPGLTDVETNQVSDLAPLQGLTDLAYLYLDGNAVSDLTPLKGLHKLEGLFLQGNRVSDLRPLIGLRRLEGLYLQGQTLDLSTEVGVSSGVSLRDLAGAVIKPSTGAPDFVFDAVTGQWQFSDAGQKTLSWEQPVSVGYTEGVWSGTITQSVAPAPAPVVTRLAGVNRYLTNVAVSQRFGVPGGTVFVATGALFPDALSVGPVAAKANGNLVLTDTKALGKETRAELVRLAPKKVVVVGGTGAVSANVESQLRGLPSRPVVSRVGGVNRYETSLEVVRSGLGKGELKSVYFATGDNYADALVAGPLAVRDGGAVVVIPGMDANSAQLTSALTVVKDLGVSKVVVMGASGVVSNAVQAKIDRTLGVKSVRFGGVNFMRLRWLLIVGSRRLLILCFWRRALIFLMRCRFLFLLV